MLNVIDEWFDTNGTRRSFPNVANVTLDWSTEKDSMELSVDEVLSVLLNGTFMDLDNPKSSEFTPPDMVYGVP